MLGSLDMQVCIYLWLWHLLQYTWSSAIQGCELNGILSFSKKQLVAYLTKHAGARSGKGPKVAQIFLLSLWYTMPNPHTTARAR